MSSVLFPGLYKVIPLLKVKLGCCELNSLRSSDVLVIKDILHGVESIYEGGEPS